MVFISYIYHIFPTLLQAIREKFKAIRSKQIPHTCSRKGMVRLAADMVISGLFCYLILEKSCFNLLISTYVTHISVHCRKQKAQTPLPFLEFKYGLDQEQKRTVHL